MKFQVIDDKGNMAWQCNLNESGMNEKGEYYDFKIGVMNVDGANERMISKAYHVEGPTWAPNGRVLMYFKQEKSDSEGKGGKVRLFRVDITGYNEREIITPSDASDPAWSPLIP